MSSSLCPDRSPVVLLRWALALLLGACSTSDRAPSSQNVDGDGGARDGGGETPTIDPSDGAPQPTFARALGMGSEACAGAEATSDLPLEILPDEFVSAFRLIGSTCDSLPTNVLLRNAGTSPVRIEGLSINEPGFSLASEMLPLELPPGKTFSVSVRYLPDAPVIAEAVLTVATSTGCRNARVFGLATSEEGVITYSPLAIDFGEVPVGASSEPRKVTLVRQSPPGAAPSEISGFGLAPEGFSSSPVTTVAEGQCTTMQLEVAFQPVSVGPVQSALGWSVSTAQLEGILFLPLYGTGVASSQ